MVDWNVIRYITDKIGQGEEPADIKRQLVTNVYDMKLINESFTQAIPWLKQEQADKIKAMQAADKPAVQPVQPPGAQPIQKPVEQQTQAPVPKPQPAAEPPVKNESSEEDKAASPIKRIKIKRSWIYILTAIVVMAILLYFFLR